MENGMQQGSLMAKVLKEIEEEWIKNNFKITKDRIKEIIQFIIQIKYIQHLIFQNFFHLREYLLLPSHLYLFQLKLFLLDF